MECCRICSHEHTIIDEREGCYVCTTCGLVIDSYYVGSSEKKYDAINEESRYWLEETRDILDRMNIPHRFAADIVRSFEQQCEKKSRKNLLSCAYSVLNNKGICISLVELSNVSACPKSKILDNKSKYENVNVEINKSELVDKYCAMLNIDFKTSSLIKDKMKSIVKAGHSPTTIVAGCIYIICKQTNRKISIKKISECASVSPISIQRFIKYERLHS